MPEVLTMTEHLRPRAAARGPSGAKACPRPARRAWGDDIAVTDAAGGARRDDVAVAASLGPPRSNNPIRTWETGYSPDGGSAAGVAGLSRRTMFGRRRLNDPALGAPGSSLDGGQAPPHDRPPAARPLALLVEPVTRAPPATASLPVLIEPTPPPARETPPARLPPREKPPLPPPERTCARRPPSQIRQPTSSRPAAFGEIGTSISATPLTK